MSVTEVSLNGLVCVIVRLWLVHSDRLGKASEWYSTCRQMEVFGVRHAMEETREVYKYANTKPLKKGTLTDAQVMMTLTTLSTLL